MQRFKLIIFFILSIPICTAAQKSDSAIFNQHKELVLRWDNDAFFSKDYYYTQGSHISFINPSLRKNPLNHVLFRLKNADNYYGIDLAHEIFTPKDILDTLLNLSDRPYAGTLFLRTFLVSSSPGKRLRLTTQIDLGVLGSLSGAEQVQKLVHRWTNSKPPEGWDFQIKNRPYLNFNTLIDKELITLPQKADFTASSRVRIGSIHDDLKLGGKLRFGKLNNQFKGYNLMNRKYDENHNYQAFVYGGANVTFVLYNATLMGGIIPPESEHEFKLNEIEKFVGEIYGGIQISYKNFGLRAKLIWETKEFKQGEKHSWGVISLFLRL